MNVVTSKGDSWGHRGPEGTGQQCRPSQGLQHPGLGALSQRVDQGAVVSCALHVVPPACGRCCTCACAGMPRYAGGGEYVIPIAG